MFEKKEDKHQEPKNSNGQADLSERSDQAEASPSIDKKQAGQVESDPASLAPESDANAAETNVTGRAVFAVETSGAGIVVRTAFLTEDSRLIEMPAVFPDIVHAMSVIDDLKAQVIMHFSRAAQVGAQVIAGQNKQEQEQGQAATEPAADSEARNRTCI